MTWRRQWASEGWELTDDDGRLFPLAMHVLAIDSDSSRVVDSDGVVVKVGKPECGAFGALGEVGGAPFLSEIFAALGHQELVKPERGHALDPVGCGAQQRLAPASPRSSLPCARRSQLRRDLPERALVPHASALGAPPKPESTGVVGVWGLPRPRKRPPDLRRL